MPNTCVAITDIGSYSEKQTKTVSANDSYLFWINGLMATRVDVVILSISGDVGVEDIVLSSQNYSDGTANQYIKAKWEKGLFTIACASPSGYFQTAEMHFISPTGTCTVEYVMKITSPSSILEKRLSDSLNKVISGDAVFHPYYENIIDCYIERTASRNFILSVVDRGGVVSTETITISDQVEIISRNFTTSYGLLFSYKKNAIFFLSVGEVMRLGVQTRFDTSSTSLDYYPISTVLTDRWFPTYNGLFKLEKTSGSTTIPLVDNKDGFDTDGKDIQFFYLFLKDVLPDSKTVVATSYIQGKFQAAINSGHRRIGLVFCPSTEGSTNEANTDYVGGVPVYYHFPTWMLFDLMAHATYKPYIFDRTDTYTSATIKMYNLDWRDEYTRNLYKTCIQIVVNYLKSTDSQLYGKPLYNYIDVVKVAFAGTWGEGTTLNTQNYPATLELAEISDYITDTLFPDKLCLRSLASALNAEFPKAYRNYILNQANPKRLGVFYDGAGQEPSDYFFTSVNTYTASNPSLMNQIYNYVKNHPCYVECAQYINDNNIPNYSSTGAFAKYFRPCYFNLHNIAFNVLQSEKNLPRVIRQTSHFVGYRPYILINRCALNNNHVVKIDISIGNYGTARFFQSYWKMRFYAQGCSSSGTQEWEEMHHSSFDLSTIPSPFEVGVPNYHDTICWSYNWTMNHTVASGKRFNLLVAIVDAEGIITDPILFCNDEESLPREYNGTTPTGRFFLIQNLLCS